MRDCVRCGGGIDHSFRFCPWCAAPQRLKLVEFFRPHRLLAGDRGKALRVSRYLGPSYEQRHVRFSVWNDVDERAEATAAVSLDEREAERLGRFLGLAAGEPPPSGVGFRLRELRDSYLSARR